MSPHLEGKKGNHHTDEIYTVETREGGWGTTQKLSAENGATTNMGTPYSCGQQKTADCTDWPTLAQSLHWNWCVNEHSKTQGNADLWWMHWCKCLTKHCLTQENADILVNALACVHNNSADSQGNTNKLFFTLLFKLHLTA